MKRINVLFLLVVCFATAAQAQTTAPKPSPEMSKLHAWVGHWTMERETQPGPLGPGGKVTGELTGHMILKGFFFEGQGTGKGPKGLRHSLEIDGYDPVNKTFVSHAFMDDGTAFSGVFTIKEDSGTWRGKLVAGGKEYQLHETLIFAPDLMSMTAKSEISTDGKTWTPFSETKFTKVKPAAKK